MASTSAIFFAASATAEFAFAFSFSMSASAASRWSSASTLALRSLVAEPTAEAADLSKASTWCSSLSAFSCSSATLASASDSLASSSAVLALSSALASAAASLASLIVALYSSLDSWRDLSSFWSISSILSFCSARRSLASSGLGSGGLTALSSLTFLRASLPRCSA